MRYSHCDKRHFDRHGTNRTTRITLVETKNNQPSTLDKYNSYPPKPTLWVGYLPVRQACQPKDVLDHLERFYVGG